MFTQCPDCQRQFRIRADQLTAADGQVKCGYCGTQFNALERLYDAPLTAAASRAPTAPDMTAEPAAALPVDTEDVEDAAGPALPEPEFDIPPETGSLDEQPVEPESLNEPSIDVAESAVSDASIDTAAEDLAAATLDRSTGYVFPEPEFAPALSAPRRNRVLWGVGSVLLMLLLVIQAGWFFRDRVVMRYPQALPYLQQLCERINCRVSRYDQLEGIRLVNRDVREHPRYSDSLLVNATMVNESDRTQAFPRVQLSLLDNEGKVLSWRRFQPEEYLDDSINRETGMQVNEPVHFVLEVTGPTGNAVSFEFDFLEAG